MKIRSRFTVEGRMANNGEIDRFKAETEARVTMDIEDGNRVLKISGTGLWARLRLTNSEAKRISELLSKPANLKDPETGEQVVFFPRKAKVTS